MDYYVDVELFLQLGWVHAFGLVVNYSYLFVMYRYNINFS